MYIHNRYMYKLEYRVYMYMYMYILLCMWHTHAQSSKNTHTPKMYAHVHKKCSLSMLQTELPNYSYSISDRIYMYTYLHVHCSVHEMHIYNMKPTTHELHWLDVCQNWHDLCPPRTRFLMCPLNTWVRVRLSLVHTYRVSRVVTVQIILQFGYGPLWRGAAHSEVVHGSVGRIDDHMYHSPRPVPLYTRIIANDHFHFCLLFMNGVSIPRD